MFDLDNNTVSLPAEKLSALLDLIDEWLDKSRATKKQFASLAGELINASNVVRSGRLPTSSVLANKRLSPSVYVPVLIDEACRADLRWWRKALLSRNGVSFLEHNFDVSLAMVASGHGWAEDLPGLAGFNFATNEYWLGPPPSDLVHLDIRASLHRECARLGISPRKVELCPSYLNFQNHLGSLWFRLIPSVPQVPRQAVPTSRLGPSYVQVSKLGEESLC